jgi:hypothetical protein
MAAEAAAVLVLCAGQAFTTSSRKNCGDRQTSVPPNRDHNPTGATEWPGRSRNSKSFSSAKGTGICSSVPRSHLIAVIRTQPLRILLSTSSTVGTALRSESAAGSISAPRFDPEGPGGERTTLPTFIPERAKAILSSSLKTDIAATGRSSRMQIHLSTSSRSQYLFRSTSVISCLQLDTVWQETHHYNLSGQTALLAVNSDHALATRKPLLSKLFPLQHRCRVGVGPLFIDGKLASCAGVRPVESIAITVA